MSGGSDFHGTRKINHNLGIGRGNLRIDESVVQEWITNYIQGYGKKYIKQSKCYCNNKNIEC